MSNEHDSDYFASLPTWAGSKFVATTHHETPAKHDPRKQTLPSPFTAVITGASRGIGKGIATCFAQAGASGLILTARKACSLEETKKVCEDQAKARNGSIKIILLAADNAVESSAVNIAEVIQKEFNGKLDLLVNNAGILNTDETAFGKLGDINASQIEVPMNVNFLGRFYMIKHLLPFIKASNAKAIVNITSIGSHLPGPLGFSISALATNRLSQRVAESHGDEGVVCYAVHPGAVFPEDPSPGLPAAFREFSKDKPTLCGGMLVWLVKEKREWLNGRYLDATWDVDELEAKREEIVNGDKLKMRLVV